MSEGVGLVKGRVLRTVGGVYLVETDGGAIECALRGRLKRERGLGRVAVGDEVKVRLLEDGSGVIEGVLPRQSRLSRRTAGGRRERVIAANVDQLAAVFSVTEPAPVFPLLDRFLVLAESNGIGAFVVVNKLDLVSGEEAAALFDDYERVGYEVLYVSALRERGLEALLARLRDQVTLFVGPSGAGKSSLLNALEPGLGLRVGEVSRALQRGKHTTVAASLHPLEQGGYVVDTPGLGKLSLWQVGVRELADCFPEFRDYLSECRFPDCTHSHEPGCAVLEAKERGAIAEQRYQSYLKILEEQHTEGRERGT